MPHNAALLQTAARARAASRWPARSDIPDSSSPEFLVRGMSREQRVAYSPAGLEEICAHGDGFHPGAEGNFPRRQTLEIHQVEDFALSLRETGEELTNKRCRALAIDPAAGIGRVDVPRWARRRGQRQPTAALSRAAYLRGGPPRDPVEPCLERTVGAIVPDLAVRTHENFLGDVVCFVGIVRERQCPAEHRRVK